MRSASVLTPGVGIQLPTRYTASIPRVNNTRLRRSATAKRFFSVSSTVASLLQQSETAFLLRDSLGLTTRGGQLLGGLAAEFMRLHGQRLGDLAPRQHLDERRTAADDAALAQRIDGHRGALVEQLLELIEVHHVVLGAEDVREAALRHAPVQRHLAAFEAALEVVARARLRALVAAARRLAKARTGTTADALLLELRPIGRFEIVERHISYQLPAIGFRLRALS